MICTGCIFSLSRKYLHENEKWYCVLDGNEVGIRLIECDGFQGKVEIPLVCEPVVSTSSDIGLQKMAEQAKEVIEDAGFIPRKRGWPAGKKRK